MDIIELYEPNRKEGAAMLLDVAKWVAPGTFKDSKAKKQAAEEGDEEQPASSEWLLEHMIVEVGFDPGPGFIESASDTGFCVRPYSVPFSHYRARRSHQPTTTHS